ncbi:MAG: hypothetical protein KGI60_03660, partial [Patescibacteria group bacterium]|nr:hypothetical protein [Patescibacteria group bacterium]
MDNNSPLGNNQQPAGFPPAQPSRPTPPPPPPPPEITLRTMKSDMEGLKQGGGTMQAPKPFTPAEFSRE